MSPIISVIMPVYNVDKYISSSISSVLNQTFKNFELILVNDGSTDNSGKICNAYYEKDNRVVVKFIKNNGVSNARNTGVKIARGLWLVFLDGDDTLELNALEIIYKILQQYNDIDMILGSFKYIYGSRVVAAINKNDCRSGIELAYDYGRWHTKICIGSFAVQKKIFVKNKILFNKETKYGEDVEVINYCLVNSRRVKVISDCFFNYNIHSTSAISKVDFDRFDCYDSRNRTFKYISAKFPEYKQIEFLYKDYLLPEAIIDTIYLLCRKGISLIKIIKYLREKDYYKVLYLAKNNKNTPENMKRKIYKFLTKPIFVWLECYLSNQYYNIRSNLGLLKRRVSNEANSIYSDI